MLNKLISCSNSCNFGNESSLPVPSKPAISSWLGIQFHMKYCYYLDKDKLAQTAQCTPWGEHKIHLFLLEDRIHQMIVGFLNCPCHLYGSIYNRMHNELPIVQYIQKCMLIWKFCCYFSFVYAICLSKMKTHHVTRD